jgi:uncharacterized membrane protein YgcG
LPFLHLITSLCCLSFIIRFVSLLLCSLCCSPFLFPTSKFWQSLFLRKVTPTSFYFGLKSFPSSFSKTKNLSTHFFFLTVLSSQAFINFFIIFFSFFFSLLSFSFFHFFPPSLTANATEGRARRAPDGNSGAPVQAFWVAVALAVALLLAMLTSSRSGQTPTSADTTSSSSSSSSALGLEQIERWDQSQVRDWLERSGYMSDAIASITQTGQLDGKMLVGIKQEADLANLQLANNPQLRQHLWLDIVHLKLAALTAKAEALAAKDADNNNLRSGVSGGGISGGSSSGSGGGGSSGSSSGDSSDKGESTKTPSTSAVSYGLQLFRLFVQLVPLLLLREEITQFYQQTHSFDDLMLSGSFSMPNNWLERLQVNLGIYGTDYAFWQLSVYVLAAFGLPLAGCRISLLVLLHASLRSRTRAQAAVSFLTRFTNNLLGNLQPLQSQLLLLGSALYTLVANYQVTFSATNSNNSNGSNNTNMLLALLLWVACYISGKLRPFL